MANHANAAGPTLSAAVDAPRRLWPVGVLAAAGLVGVLAGFDPRLALAALAAATIVPLVVAQPLVGVYALVFLSFLETFSGITSGLSLTKLLGALVVLGWVATVATAPPAERAQRSLLTREPVLAAALVLFAAWVGMSLAWAERPGETQGAFVRFTLNFFLFPIVLATVRKPRHVVWLFVVFIAAALTSVAFAVASGEESASAEDRLVGFGVNPNQLGALLIIAVVLAATLAAIRSFPPLARGLALGAAGVAAAGLFMTQSRGALVGLAAALVVAPVVVGRGRRAAALVLVIATLVGTVGWFSAVAPDSAVERVTSPGSSGGSGREDLWTLGWRMVEDHPVRGVGAGNFPVSSIHYLLQPGRTERDELVIDTPKVAHNIYLTVLSELGIVGLALFTAILIAALAACGRAARLFARAGDPASELLARGLIIALVGFLVASFFSSQIYEKQLWLLLATGPALLAMAERRTRESDVSLAAVTSLRGLRSHLAD
jgi:O-antigen ligase